MSPYDQPRSKKEVLPEDLKEVINRVAKDAEDMELRLSEFRFIHSMKMVSVAVGGAIFVFGLLFTLLSIFLFTNMMNLAMNQNARVIISSFSLLIGVTQLIAGTLLISK